MPSRVFQIVVNMANNILKIALLLLLFQLHSVEAKTYLTQKEFLSQVFNDATPEKKILWLNKDIQSKLTKILDHKYPKLRLKYWQHQGQTVWFMEKIGKEKPISFGISIKNERVHQIRVLAFRESRGWEIKMKSFTDQFDSIGTDEKNNLDQHIDGITGATMSVNAMKKITRAALMLAKHVD